MVPMSPTFPSRLQQFLRSLPDFPIRESQGHKGTYGLAFLIGGSLGMSGSIALAGRAALVAGAGLVRLAIPRSILPTVAGFAPEYMTVPLPEDTEGRIAEKAGEKIFLQSQCVTAVGLGPGLGRSAELDRLVRRLFLDLDRPLVVDADALNALSEEESWFGQVRRKIDPEIPKGPRILTPHPGEFARLTGVKPPCDTQGRMESALEFAKRFYDREKGACPPGQFVLILKGHETVITDGESVYVNQTGNPGMATGGSGDVLTGILTALLAQGFSPTAAARLGVALHGLAGDVAAKDLPFESMIASDLIKHFPTALNELRFGNY